MENHKKELDRPTTWMSLKSYSDEATYDKIHRHLTDINDIISEEDIRNVKLFAVVNETEMTASKKRIKKAAR